MLANNLTNNKRMDLDLDVSRLKIMKSDYQSKKYQMEDDLLKHYPEQIQETQGYITGLQADLQTLKQNMHPDGEFAGMQIHGMDYKYKEDAGSALLDACMNVANTEVEIGSYLGFKMFVTFSGHSYRIILKGSISYQVDIGNDIYGNITRLNNALGKMEEQLRSCETKLQNLLQQQEAAKVEVGKPFPFEEELAQKSARLAELDAQLNIGARSPGHTAS